MTDLSVVIVSFNTSHLTLECIKSVDRVSEDIKVDIILVDNASKDDTLKLLKGFKPVNVSFKIIKNSKNLGFAKAVNIGINKSVGKYKFLLNSDAIVKKGVFEKLLEFAESKKDIAAVAPRLINADGSIQGSVFRLPTVSRAVKQYWIGEGNLLDKYAPKDKKPIEVEAVSMAALLITPKCLSEVGLLDERYFMYFEDLDYCRRINTINLKVYYHPLVSVEHHHGVSGKSISSDDTQWRRLIPSSKLYHGSAKHHLITFIIWSGQKLRKL